MRLVLGPVGSAVGLVWRGLTGGLSSTGETAVEEQHTVPVGPVLVVEEDDHQAQGRNP